MSYMLWTQYDAQAYLTNTSNLSRIYACKQNMALTFSPDS